MQEVKMEVIKCKLKAISSGWSDDGEMAYRIRFHCTDGHRSLPIKFARSQDAQCGIKALKRLARFSGTVEEVTVQLREIGIKQICKVICEAMKW